MRTWIALATAVVSCAPAGCSRSTVRPSENADVPVCAAHICQSVGGAGPAYLIGGTTLSVLSFGSPCRIEASWPLADAAEDSFRATLDARQGEVFALHGYVVQLSECHGVVIRRDAHPLPPGADLFLDPPDQAWAAPDRENVFIPLSGEATLDGSYVARAALEGSDEGQAESVTVTVSGATDPPSVYRNLRTGGAFRWGSHRAAIVTVVAPKAPLVGWVEVRLF